MRVNSFEIETLLALELLQHEAAVQEWATPKQEKCSQINIRKMFICTKNSPTNFQIYNTIYNIIYLYVL